MWEFDVDTRVWSLIKCPNDVSQEGQLNIFAPHWLTKEVKEWLPDN